MRIAVFGAGGVGGYFGGRLAAADVADVHLIARSAHLTALERNGLTVRSVRGDLHVDVPATDDPSEVGPVDVVLFTVKSTDTAPAAAQLAPLLHDDTAVVSLQNGVDNERQVAEVIGVGHVLGGAAFIFATIAEPGVIEHTGGPTRFVFGELDGGRTDRAQRFLEVCEGAGIDAQLSDDIVSVMWRKFVFICAQAGMTAATRLPIGEIRTDERAWAMFRSIAEEAAAVAAAEDVALADSVVDDAVAVAEDLEADSRSSLHYDLEHGKPMELDALNASVSRRGNAVGIPTPANDAIAAILSPWAARHARNARR